MSANIPEKDELYEAAKKIVVEDNNGRISNLQRKLFVGYNRTARLMEELEKNGVVSKHDVKGLRTILVSKDEL